MAKGIVIYYSRSGNTKQMAEIITGAMNEAVRVWDTRSGEYAFQVSCQWGLAGVDWSPIGTRFASAAYDHSVRVWNAQTRRVETRLRGHSAEVNGVAWAPDGRRLASASADGTVCVWDTEQGRGLRALAGHRGPVWDAKWSPDGAWIATACDDGAVRVWDPETGAERACLTSPQSAWRLAWAPDGSFLVSAHKVGIFRVWDVRPAG